MIYLKKVLLALLNLFVIGCNKSSVSQIADLQDKIWGIDLSHHQGSIDWEKLSVQKPHFMFLKATEGTTHIDTKYHQVKRMARRHSIITGSYHFFNFNKDGRTQAHFFCLVADIGKGELPPVLDLETNGLNMPSKEIVSVEIAEFIETVEAKTGVKPIIYCNKRFYNTYLKNDLMRDCKLWICDYKREPDLDWNFWQKTDKHKLPGIKGFVDLNFFNGPREELLELVIK